MNKIKMMHGIDAIIFDLDGTLLDSMWVWEVVDEEYMSKYQLPMPTYFQKDIEGMSFTETAQYFLQAFPTLGCTVAEVMEEWTALAYEKYLHEVPLKAGVAEFLAAMRTAGKKLGIATSNTRTLVEETLLSLGIAHYFNAVRTACEVEKGKPAPDVYLAVAADLEVAPERCLVFEDVPMGILAGKNAGMKVCGIDDAFSRAQEARKRELADYYITSYSDILETCDEVTL